MDVSGTLCGTSLPRSVQQIADVIGNDAALYLVNRLSRAYTKGHPAGQPILYVPKSLSSDHPLTRILGLPDAQRIVQAFGGEILYPATCFEVLRQRRNHEVIGLVRQGWHVRDVARAFGLTVRQVRNLCADIGPEALKREVAS